MPGSMICTWYPNSSSAAAAQDPAMPPPAIMTSLVTRIISDSRSLLTIRHHRQALEPTPQPVFSHFDFGCVKEVPAPSPPDGLIGEIRVIRGSCHKYLTLLE